MYAFFFTLYQALFAGEWSAVTYDKSLERTSKILQILFNLTLNAFGGNFDTFQQGITIDKYFIADFFPMLLSVITMFTIAFAVFGIVKKIFSIFFVGVR